MNVFSGAAPSVTTRNGVLVYPAGAAVLLANVGHFDNELAAYLRFDYIRSRPSVNEANVFLLPVETSSGAAYQICLMVANDMLEAVPYLAELQAHAYIENFDLIPTVANRLPYLRAQTAIFIAAYNRPVREKLERIDPRELVAPVARFMVFKSRTDPRVRAGDPRLAPLTMAQAAEMAADVIAVAQFYDLPLELFLGIGAMENNYLDVRGDLANAVWKKRPQEGDIILQRRRRGVLVSNYSTGVWQITRETLRYAHQLFLRDNRDYSQLPERLRPPQKLEFDLTNPHVLTTYAGLLLRDLLDRFAGDLQKAIGAYNGGFRNPNLQYATGVDQVATYARNILARVAAANGRLVAAAHFVSRPRPRTAQPR